MLHSHTYTPPLACVTRHNGSKVFQLRGKSKISGDDQVEKFDRGEVEIEICWRERLYEYDLELAQQKHTMARRIQCMARKFAAKKAAKRARKERDENLKVGVSPLPPPLSQPPI